MNIFAKNETRKNTKISFRTDDETLAQLKSICRIENKTISSLIESILTEHVLVHENPLLIEQEKRQSPRKKCSIPAVAVFKINNSKNYYNSTIVSLSSNSAQIVLRNFSQLSKLGNSFYLLFNLPKNDYPLLLECTLVRSKCIDGECIIVSNFVHDTSKNSELLQKFLTLNEFSGDS
jgi:hypothetical protein